ncbi:MAG: NnrS family protein [Geminicoccaceae bacterium]
MSAKAAGIPRYRPFAGPALLRQGFRPFFLGAGLWALVAMTLWVAALQGYLALPTAFDPVAWHVHEMLFGFVVAAIAGFLLTAIPNWTGRMPLQGLPLAILVGVWLAGRLAVYGSERIGAGSAAALDLAFLSLLLGVVLREILTGRNWRNLPMPVALGGLLAANALTHADAAGIAATGPLGQRLGIGIVILLISLVGGRIIPSFTLNWLKKRGAARLPARFGAPDRVALGLLAAALVAWVIAPESHIAGTAMVGAGLAALIRLARWCSHLTLVEPLVWSLHLGYAWVPIGLLLTGLGAFLPDLPQIAGLHALTAGAMGGMTLAVMTRATLGHTGRPLIADRWTAAAYLLVAAAAALRVAAPFSADGYLALLWAAGLAWCAAFGLFAVRYGRLLLAR